MISVAGILTIRQEKNMKQLLSIYYSKLAICIDNSKYANDEL